MKKKTLIVTGASGFVGTNFINKYLNEYDIVSVSLQTTQVENISFKNVDAILHLAGIAHQFAEVPQEKYYEVNTELPLRLAKKAKEAGVRQFVFFSTVKVYGCDGVLDRHDMVLNENSPTLAADPYGKSKAMAELALKDLDDDSFKVAIVRPPMIYGEGVKGNMASLIRLVDKVPVLPFDYSENQRTVVSIKNLLHMTDLIIKSEARGIFLGQDEKSLSLRELIDAICEGLSKKRIIVKLPKFIFNLLVAGKKDIMTRLFGTLKFEQEGSFNSINYKPVETTKQGIKDMCSWYLRKKGKSTS